MSLALEQGSSSEPNRRVLRLDLIRERQAMRQAKEEEIKMGSEIVESWGAERRDDFLWFNPDNIVVVGVDTDGKGNALHEPDRAKMKLDEGMVLNILKNGVLQPITVRKNGNKPDGMANVEAVTPDAVQEPVPGVHGAADGAVRTTVYARGTKPSGMP